MTKKQQMLSIVMLALSLSLLQSCDEDQAKKAAEAEQQRATQKMEEVRASGAPKLAPQPYSEAADHYDAAKQDYETMKYSEAKTELGRFYDAADIAIREANAARQAMNTVPAPAKKTSAAPNSITVKKGDHLYQMARDLYGDGEKWRVIYDLNKDQIKDENLIYPEQVFKLAPKN
jgi:nucleoid-associated protein YgaU